MRGLPGTEASRLPSRLQTPAQAAVGMRPGEDGVPTRAEARHLPWAGAREAGPGEGWAARAPARGPTQSVLQRAPRAECPGNYWLGTQMQVRAGSGDLVVSRRKPYTWASCVAAAPLNEWKLL